MTWKEENEPLGRLLGYPQCCIDEFCRDSPENLPKLSKNEIRMRVEAGSKNGQFTGFIPCLNHAQKILLGEITLESLIKNRDPRFGEFPYYALY